MSAASRSASADPDAPAAAPGGAAGDADGLRQAIRAALARPDSRLGEGNQGEAYRVEHDGRPLIVKTTSGRGVRAWLRRRMLAHEHRVYRRLAGIDGVPRCHGLIDGRFLVLDRIDAVSLRDAQITDAAFHDRFLALIQALHARGVAHGDLKRKDNVLVRDGAWPVVIDFGVAVIRKDRFAPLNRWRFDMNRRFDLHAYLKHRHGRYYVSVPEEDRRYLERTRLERASKRLKWYWRKLTGKRF